MSSATKTLKLMLYHDRDNNVSQSLCGRTRSHRSRQSRIGTAVIAVVMLLISTTAWLSLVFSGTTTRCWNHFKDWESSTQDFPWRKHQSDRLFSCSSMSTPMPPSDSQKHAIGGGSSDIDNGTWGGLPGVNAQDDESLSLKHIVFGIAGSSQLWKRRKHFVKLWWRPSEMRGHVWLEEQVTRDDGDDGKLPSIMVSEDISRFRYTNPTGHPSGLRIARIVSECFRLGLPNVRWFVLGDDDTIFNVDNLVAVLNKYNSSEMVYIGSPSESHSANTYFSHFMAFGGGGIAISHPLAEALSKIQDECLERYPKLYGSDDRLHACITELGIPLTRELGFHQWDIRGSAHGLLSAHPIAPFVSIHHVEAVDPIFPGLTTLQSLKLFTLAMRFDPRSILQRSICYDHSRRLTYSVSLGYVVQVFPNIVLPRDLERSEQTYSAWNRINHRSEFDFDTRDRYKSGCKKPILFFLKNVRKEGNATLGTYRQARVKDDLRRKVFCFPRLPPLRNVQDILVVGHPLSSNWHLMPRRLCCKLNYASEKQSRLVVGQCEKGFTSTVAAV